MVGAFPFVPALRLPAACVGAQAMVALDRVLSGASSWCSRLYAVGIDGSPAMPAATLRCALPATTRSCARSPGTSDSCRAINAIEELAAGIATAVARPAPADTLGHERPARVRCRPVALEELLAMPSIRSRWCSPCWIQRHGLAGRPSTPR